MPLRHLLIGRFRRRRPEADRVWPLAIWKQGDAERVRREAARTQAEARAEAFRRILEQARSRP